MYVYIYIIHNYTYRYIEHTMVTYNFQPSALAPWFIKDQRVRCPVAEVRLESQRQKPAGTSQPSEKYELVSWDYDSQDMEK